MNIVQRNNEEFPSLPRLEQLPVFIQAQTLDEFQGTNRADTQLCQLRAKNDYEAIYCWLHEYQHKPTTYRLYQKEAERLLLWCIFQQRKAFSSLDREDLETYFNFLSDPQPKRFWCAAPGGRGNKRGDVNWRPFAGPLSPSTKTTAITIIHSLLAYLTDARYLVFNPLTLMRKRHHPTQNIEEQALKVQERILEIDEWQAILKT